MKINRQCGHTTISRFLGGAWFRTMRMLRFLFVLGLFFRSLGNIEAGDLYQHWPAEPGWVALTNHITSCYASVNERLAVLGRPSLAEPLLVYPFKDYQRLAESIEQICPDFVNMHFADADGCFTTYLQTQGGDGEYPSEPPCWTKESLMAELGINDWATHTNVVLTSWMFCDHAIQVQVTDAINLLTHTLDPVCYPWAYVTERSCYSLDFGRCAASNHWLSADWCDSTLYKSTNCLAFGIVDSAVTPPAFTNYLIQGRVYAQTVYGGEDYRDYYFSFGTNRWPGEVDRPAWPFLTKPVWEVNGVTVDSDWLQDVTNDDGFRIVTQSMFSRPDWFLDPGGWRGNWWTPGDATLKVTALEDVSSAGLATAHKPYLPLRRAYRRSHDFMPSSDRSWGIPHASHLYARGAYPEIINRSTGALRNPELLSSTEYTAAFVFQVETNMPALQRGVFVLADSTGLVQSAPTSSFFNVSGYPFDGEPIIQNGWGIDRAFWVTGWSLDTVTLAAVSRNHETVDTDVDGLYDVGVAFNNSESLLGVVTFRPDLPGPFICLPRSIGDGDGSGILTAYSTVPPVLPYHVIPTNECSQVDWAGLEEGLFDCEYTRVLESVVALEDGVQVKRASILRPTGSVIAFEFSPEGESFASVGYPIGTNQYRRTVLHDLTPDVHTDKRYALTFPSGVTHSFAPVCDYDVDPDEGQQVVSVIADGKWQDTANYWSYYAPSFKGGWPAEGDSTHIVFAPDGAPHSVTNSAGLSVSISSDGKTLTYPWGTRVLTSGDSAPYTVHEVTTTVDGETAVVKTQFDAWERMTSRTITVSGCCASADTSAEWGWSYPGYSDARTRVGIRKSMLPGAFTPPGGGSVVTLAYDADGFLQSKAWPTGNEQSQSLTYSYAAVAPDDVYALLNRSPMNQQPMWRTRTLQHGGTTLSAEMREVRLYAEGALASRWGDCWWDAPEWPRAYGLSGYAGYFYDGIAVHSEAETAAWGPEFLVTQAGTDLVWDSEGSDTFSSEATPGFTSAQSWCFDQPVSVTNISAVSTTALSIAKGSVTATTLGQRQTVTRDSCLGGGTLTLQKQDDTGSWHQVYSRSVNADELGRFSSWSDSLGNGSSNVSGTEPGLSGPELLKDNDGRVVDPEYFASGRVKRMHDRSLGFLSTQEYDALGNPVLSTLQRGKRTVKAESRYDALSRLRWHKDDRGRITTWDYTEEDFGAKCVQQSEDHGDIITEWYQDGSLKAVYGSGVKAPKRWEYGVTADGLYAVTVTAMESDGTDPSGALEWSRTVSNFRGDIVRMEGPDPDDVSSVASVEVGYTPEGLFERVTDPGGITRRVSRDKRLRINRDGVDMNNSGALDESTDRMVSNEQAVSAAGTTASLSTYPDEGSAQSETLGEMTVNHGRTHAEMVTPAGMFTADRTGWSGGERAVTLSETGGVNHVMQFENWLPSSSVREAEGAPDRTVSYHYDDFLRPFKTVESGIGTREVRRDEYDRIKTITLPGASDDVSITYFGKSDRIRSIRSSGRVQNFTWHENGLLKSRWDSNSMAKEVYEYDYQGRLAKLSRIDDGQVRSTRWERQPGTGLVTEKVHSVDTVERTSRTQYYRSDGSIDRVEDANGHVATYHYTGPDCTGITYNDTVTESVDLDIDRLGNTTGASIVGGPSFSGTLDLLGRLKTMIMQAVFGDTATKTTFAYLYSGGDSHPAWTWLCSADGLTTNRAIHVGSDVLDRAALISEQGFAACTNRFDGADRLTNSLVTVESGTPLVRTILRDSSNRTTGLVYRAGSSVVAGFSYVFHGNTNRIRKLVREDGSYWRYNYTLGGALERGTLYGTNGLRVAGRTFDYASDRFENTTAATRPAGQTASFTPNLFNLHIARDFGDRIEIVGSAPTNVIVSVDGVRASREQNRFRCVLTIDATGRDVTKGLVKDFELVAVDFPDAQSERVARQTITLSIHPEADAPVYDNRSAIEQDGRHDYTFDMREHLREVAWRGEGNGLSLSMTYYADGRRATKTVKQGSTVIRTHRFIWDGWLPVREIIEENGQETIRDYLWGLDRSGWQNGLPGAQAGGVGGLLAIRQTTNGVSRTLLPILDHIGTVHALFDPAQGEIVARYAYTPFGELIGESGEAKDACPFRYSGKYWDRETGLLYYGYRYYDPTTTKWLNYDPLGEEGGVNLTAFCRNDPVNGFDPLGLAAYFFGGTGNSLDEDAWSNVEILYRSWDKDAGHGEAVYVPGVFSGYAPDGTPYKAFKKRPLTEGAFGASLQARADEMMKQLRAQLAAGDREVNIFAFSRGSLTAIVFLNMIADQVGKDALFDDIVINQTVLFDNVEHTKFLGYHDFPHDLPKILNYKHQPLHLIAVDEQRKQFYDPDVLNIEGAVQIGFRGVHANVGGGQKNADMLAAQSLRFVAQAMREAKMNAFSQALRWKQMGQHGMRDNNATSVPSKNDRFFYTMGSRAFPKGMFLSPLFRFNRSNLKNPLDVNAFNEFSSLDWGKWAGGYKYSPSAGWVK